MGENIKVQVCDIFDSIAVEGLREGTPATFVVLIGEDVNCGYTDEKIEYKLNYEIDIETIKAGFCYGEYEEHIKKLKRKKFVVITGGEITHQDSYTMATFIEWLLNNGTQKIEIETNSANLDWYLGYISDFRKSKKVSITANLDMSKITDYEYLLNAYLGYQKLNSHDCIKIIAKTLTDVDKAKLLADRFSNTNVIVYSCKNGVPITTIADYIVDNGYDNIRFKFQLHKELFEVNKK